MISYLKGRLVEKHPPTLILESGAIGYAIEASMQTFYQLPDLGIETLLHIYPLFKEEKLVLYGFMQPEERRLFQELIKINTIGPKVALAILSNMNTDQLIQVVNHQDAQALQHIPGIGRKTAERLLLEITNRLSYWAPTESKTAMPTSTQKTDYSIKQDAISALIALGYKPQIATQAVHALAAPELSTEQLIRRVLSQWMSR